MIRKGIKLSILIPLTVSFFLIFGAFFVVFYNIKMNEVSDNLVKELETVERLFEQQIDAEVDLLIASVESIQRDDTMRTAFSSGDRDKILSLAMPMLKKLRDQHNITHLYFHDSSRVNLLRVHKPDKHGDIINRYTATKAQESGRTTAGFELGPLGTFTLRVVSPWQADDKVIGYVEMGMEIDHLLQKLHKVLDLNFVVSVYKKYLDRKEWVDGMNVLGQEANWEHLLSSVIISKTFQDIPNILNKYLDKGRHDYMEMVDSLKLVVEGRDMRVGIIPLLDVNDREIGDMVILHDVTNELANARASIAIVTITMVLIGTVLFVSFSIILGRVEKELEGHRKNLEDMVEKRTRELLISEERYRSLVENTDIGISLIDSEYNVVMVNKAYAKLLKKKPDDLIGLKCYALLDRRDDLCESCPGIQALSAGIAQEMEKEFVHDDGSRIPVMIRAFPILGESGEPTGFIEVVEDITERRRSEEERKKLQSDLFQAQKMESIGRLAGGIAHDFNNILSAVNGFAELSLLKIDNNDPLRKNIESIFSAGKRATELTGQLLAFSRKQIIQPGVVNLNTVINNMQKLLRKLVREGIEISVATNDRLWNIKADNLQMQQIIMNFAVNANDAMPTGGKLSIETENCDISQEYIKGKYSIKPGEYVLLAISDTGCGMTKEEQEHAFEPFYTTKDTGKGTGLGLATVYGIVKQNSGFINVYSEPDQGTSFKIYLPRIKEEIQVNEEKELEDMPRGSETILLVEDEKAVREVATEMLSQLGYLVLEAEDGEDALNICKKYHGDIHLLLTDVVMPKMNGNQLAKHVRECCAGTKVLYMSGYTENAIVHRGVLEEGVSFMKKPITHRSLAQSVRTALDHETTKRK